METRYVGPLVPDPVDWQIVRRFHGHLGPWLSLGLRLGVAGMTATGAEPHFGVRVTVRCRLSPPISCMLDGLQWSTGATLGKRNLLVEEGEPYSVTIEDVDSGRQVTYLLSRDLEDLFREWVQQLGEREATIRAWEEEGIFTTCVERIVVAH